MTEVGVIKNAMMCGAVSTNKSCSIECKCYRKILETNFMKDLVIGTLEK